MRFFTTSDANSVSGIDEVSNALYKGGFEEYFSEKYYDDSGIKITIVFMCRSPHLNFKQRIRFSKKENKLYIDIMLDLDVMSSADPETRKRIVGEKLVNEVPQIIAKKKFKNFDLPRFSRDLRDWFEQHGWIQPIFPED